MIIYRNNDPKNRIYKFKNGEIVEDPVILDYIKKLVIPPAYKDVEIFYEKKTPKMLYFGYDDKGRKQQIYSKKWREKADKEKFKALIEFGELLPEMNKKINDNMKSEEFTKDKIISLILLLSVKCGFRIGQLKYHEMYNSVGLSTLQKKHIKFLKNKVEIAFIGKKGMLNECDIEDKNIINELKKLTDNIDKDDFVFTYVENKERKQINAIEVNNWLKFYNENFTTKFFRTFEVNAKLIEELIKNPDIINMTKTQRKKIIVENLKCVSKSINNTPAICKKSYINKDLVEMFIEQPKKFKKNMIDISANKSPSEIFISFLKSIYTKGGKINYYNIHNEHRNKTIGGNKKSKNRSKRRSSSKSKKRRSIKIKKRSINKY